MNALRTVPALTVTLIVLSAAASIPILMGNSNAVLPWLIASPDSAPFVDVMRGEAWRLVTPIFLHFGILHILFNMMWLWDLGRESEALKGRFFLALFVVLTGVASNVAQYTITGSPFFGGMSGVVYALLGYVWMQARFNPMSGFVLHRGTVLMMLVWYVLCWTGLVGPIANWAHTAGLVLGVAWGFLDRRNPRSNAIGAARAEQARKPR